MDRDDFECLLDHVNSATNHAEELENLQIISTVTDIDMRAGQALYSVLKHHQPIVERLVEEYLQSLRDDNDRLEKRLQELQAMEKEGTWGFIKRLFLR